jgi:SAM-dependent methyltransferase
MEEAEVRGGTVSSRRASTAGYAELASALASQYESVPSDEALGDLVSYLAVPPCRVADIGAGTGRDAAALAARGHEVVAVEPVREMRAVGERLHADAPISWVDDALPGLERLSGEFGLVLIIAVWMHLDQQERARALRRVVSLLAAGGRLVLTLRHGPVPAGRRMFEVAPEEVIDAGAELGLDLVHRSNNDDMLGRDDVTWTNLVLDRRPPETHPGEHPARL